MIEYLKDEALVEEIERHLRRCSDDFVPPLASRVNLADYAKKIVEKGRRIEAWHGGSLIGFLAYYLNSDFAYITNVSVLRSSRGQGIAKKLIALGIEDARESVGRMLLEIDRDNLPAISLYSKLGFRISAPDEEGECLMRLDIGKDFDAMTRDTPTARYAYDFDTEVMHPFMIRTFEPWFRHKGQTLELGAFEGAFTGRLSEKLLWSRKSITCVEASEMAARRLHNKYGDHMTIVNETFERLSLTYQYDNIFMTHVLEHVEDPVGVLKRVNDEWLAPGGRFFLACPNANAASRQIAVKMGLVVTNHAVTKDEWDHGHQRTYSLDTLEFDARRAGLRVIARGGIFFKALANKQLDAAKAADIIDDAYLEGCYALGQAYPDLCASIYLICEKGDGK